jgi:hypothetical protein
MLVEHARLGRHVRAPFLSAPGCGVGTLRKLRDKLRKLRVRRIFDSSPPSVPALLLPRHPTLGSAPLLSDYPQRHTDYAIMAESYTPTMSDSPGLDPDLLNPPSLCDALVHRDISRAYRILVREGIPQAYR